MKIEITANTTILYKGKELRRGDKIKIKKQEWEAFAPYAKQLTSGDDE
tara:strand:+ start:256 stop:399 length:144 start_codon:yes stop_codon:yes gene_type:complete